MIFPVIMAGDTGSRLWPVSRDILPKQFVKFQKGQLSLFQQTLLRLQGLKGLQSPIVLCNESHRFHAAEQLKEIGITDAEIILEPLVKNTAPAVALAAFNASQKQENAILLVLAADHLIEQKKLFHDSINRATRAANKGYLVTFGVKAERPETGYGYIKRGEVIGDFYRIADFVEKPDLKTAEKYLRSGEYYWNSGMFVFQASTYLKELSKFEPEIFHSCENAFLQKVVDPAFKFNRIDEHSFSLSPSISIDFAVMEKTSQAAVVDFSADWSDLGAWDAIYEKSSKDENGNTVLGDVCLHNVHNSYISSNARLVTVAGMDDAIVVETADSVLVTSKKNAQDVKHLVQALKSHTRQETVMPNVVPRPLGSYESLAEGPGFQVKRIIMKPGAALSLQSHQKRAETWTVVKGWARVTVGEKEIELKADQSTYIPIEVKHRLENLGKEEPIVIEVQCGSYLGEDDIERYEDRYGRIG